MAIPTWQAAGAVAESASGNISPAPPAHQAGDILLLLIGTGANEIEFVSNVAGFREAVPFIKHSNKGSASAHQAGIWWARAESSETPAPTLKFRADHIRARIVVIRGAGGGGNPITDWATSFQEATTTSVAFPAVTAADAESLVVMLVAHARDVNSSAELSGWTNSDLSGVTERLDSWSTIGGGSGHAVATGGKTSAGAIAGGIATLASGHKHLTAVLVISSAAQPVEKSPWIANYGPVVHSSVANITVPIPAGLADDIAVLMVETGSTGVTLNSAQGFAEVAVDSPQFSGISGDVAASGLHAYWKRLVGGDADPVVNVPATHVAGQIFLIRGVKKSLTPPFSDTAGGTVAIQSAIAMPGGTSVDNDSMVLQLGGHGATNESAENSISLNDNPDLSKFALRKQQIFNVGTGAGLWIASGTDLVAGVVQNSTGDLGFTNRQAYITLILPPEPISSGPGPLIADGVTLALTVQDAQPKLQAKILADLVQLALTVNDANFTIIISYLTAAEMVSVNTQIFPANFTTKRGRWSVHAPAAGSVWTKQPPES